MEVRVDDKVLLVTAAVEGLGRAVALEAARSGAAAIILTDRNTQRGDKVVSEILKLGTKAALVAADLEEQGAPARIISAAIGQFGRLDGLVNAAGLSDRGSVAEADTALFDHLFAVNTRAPMFLMQGLIRHLKERKAPGSIVNILSFQAHGAAVNLAVYGATKAALSLLTKNAAFAHRKDRIGICGITSAGRIPLESGRCRPSSWGKASHGWRKPSRGCRGVASSSRRLARLTRSYSAMLRFR